MNSVLHGLIMLLVVVHNMHCQGISSLTLSKNPVYKDQPVTLTCQLLGDDFNLLSGWIDVLNNNQKEGTLFCRRKTGTGFKNEGSGQFSGYSFTGCSNIDVQRPLLSVSVVASLSWDRNYQCTFEVMNSTVRKPWNVTSTLSHLSVYVLPKAPTLDPSGLVFNETAFARISCESKRGTPPAAIVLTVTQQHMGNFNQARGLVSVSLILPVPLKNWHNAKVTCTVKNHNFSDNTASGIVRINYNAGSTVLDRGSVDQTTAAAFVWNPASIGLPKRSLRPLQLALKMAALGEDVQNHSLNLSDEQQPLSRGAQDSAGDTAENTELSPLLGRTKSDDITDHAAAGKGVPNPSQNLSDEQQPLSSGAQDSAGVFSDTPEDTKPSEFVFEDAASDVILKQAAACKGVPNPTQNLSDEQKPLINGAQDFTVVYLDTPEDTKPSEFVVEDAPPEVILKQAAAEVTENTELNTICVDQKTEYHDVAKLAAAGPSDDFVAPQTPSKESKTSRLLSELTDQQLRENFRRHYSYMIKHLTRAEVDRITLHLLAGKMILIIEFEFIMKTTATEAASFLIELILKKDRNEMYMAFLDILEKDLERRDLVVILTSTNEPSMTRLRTEKAGKS